MDEYYTEEIKRATSEATSAVEDIRRYARTLESQHGIAEYQISAIKRACDDAGFAIDRVARHTKNLTAPQQPAQPKPTPAPSLKDQYQTLSTIETICSRMWERRNNHRQDQDEEDDIRQLVDLWWNDSIRDLLRLHQ